MGFWSPYLWEELG